MRWYSAQAQKLCLVEGKGSTLQMKSVFVFQAKDYSSAKSKAVELATGTEESYRNEQGQLVHWRVAAILTLDVIREDELDGAEVHSAISDIPESEHVDFECHFTPESSEPENCL